MGGSYRHKTEEATVNRDEHCSIYKVSYIVPRQIDIVIVALLFPHTHYKNSFLSWEKGEEAAAG